MRDFLEIIATITLSVALIGATYSLFTTWLVSLVNQAFSNLP